MADGEKRSFRLLALEDLGNDNAILALPADFGNTTCWGKKRIGEDIEDTQVSMEVGKDSVGKLMDNQTDRIINYLLDMLEAKDRHELFAMPHNFQTYDYEEIMKHPGSFAIIRQKHRDKMYRTMEAFENDILMLFAKAMETNAPNSFPYREAMDLRKHANKVFQSLKNNPIQVEFELSRWHQDYFDCNKRKLQSNGRSSSDAASMMHIGSCSHVNVTSEPENETKQCRRTNNATTRGRPRTREAIRIKDGSPQFPEGQRRNTYKPWNESNDSYITMFAKEPKTLVYNTDSISYVESMQHFVRSAGPVAKYIANKRCNEYIRGMQTQSIYSPSPFESQSTIGPQPTYIASLNFSSISKECESSIASGEFDFKSCELDTDGIWNKLSHIKNMVSSSKQEVKPELKLNTFLRGNNSNSGPNVLPNLNLTPEMQISPPSNEMPLIWQQGSSGSEPWKE